MKIAQEKVQEEKKAKPAAQQANGGNSTLSIAVPAVVGAVALPFVASAVALSTAVIGGIAGAAIGISYLAGKRSNDDAANKK